MHLFHFRAKVEITLTLFSNCCIRKVYWSFTSSLNSFTSCAITLRFFAVTAQKGQDRHNDLYDFIEHFNKLRIEN